MAGARARQSFRWPRRQLGGPLSHLISGGKPNASDMCGSIKLHTYDRQNECNIIDNIKKCNMGFNILSHSYRRHKGL
jgi:hypothetical protein